jgi:aminoglycoside phosphotransferase family enzyme/predicted kinase
MHVFGHNRIGTDVPRGAVGDALASDRFHPGNPHVEVRETDIAWVFLAGDLAYKVFKPLQAALTDFSTLDQRRLACREEVRANRELAPAIGMRVRAIVPGRSLLLADEDAQGPVEYAIEMCRFDEARTMASLVRRGRLTDEHVAAVAQRLAAFHACARKHSPPQPFLDVMRACRRNIDELLAVAGTDAAGSVQASARFTEAFLLAHGRAIAARADAGFVRDVHGELRAAHVVLDERLSIVGRVGLAPRRRATDVAEDVACLAMDLERLGDQRAAELLVQSYWDAGGELCSPELLAFYGAQHALARAKVELRRAEQLDDADAVPARQRAAELLCHAERLAWRARGPLVLAIGGPAVSGGSPLAAELSRRSGIALLSSGLVGGEHRPPASPATAPASPDAPRECATVYRELGARAHEIQSSGDSVIVDGTFGHLALRAEFLEGLRDDRALHAFEYHAPTAARERPPGIAGEDGAGATYHAWDGLRGKTVVTVRPSAGVEHVVHQIAAWLDARQAACWSPD